MCNQQQYSNYWIVAVFEKKKEQIAMMNNIQQDKYI